MSDNFSHSQIIKDPGDNYKTIGTRPVRHDGVDKVTGRAIYGNDVQLQGLIEGAILRSPVAHARIKSIDTSAAEAFPGVLAVATSADFPDPEDKVADLGEGPVNLAHLSANCLARDKVFYKGQAIAAVAARDVHIAEEALSLIKVEYERLPVLTWVLDAARPCSMKTSGPMRWARRRIRPATSPITCISNRETRIPRLKTRTLSSKESSRPRPSTRATLNPT